MGCNRRFRRFRRNLRPASQHLRYLPRATTATTEVGLGSNGATNGGGEVLGTSSRNDNDRATTTAPAPAPPAPPAPATAHRSDRRISGIPGDDGYTYDLGPAVITGDGIGDAQALPPDSNSPFGICHSSSRVQVMPLGENSPPRRLVTPAHRMAATKMPLFLMAKLSNPAHLHRKSSVVLVLMEKHHRHGQLYCSRSEEHRAFDSRWRAAGQRDHRRTTSHRTRTW